MNKIHPKIAVTITALLILLSSCQNDDNLSNPTNKKEGQLRTSKILRGKDAEAAIAMYHEQIGKAKLKNQGMMLKSGDDFTLDEAEVMVVENKRNGKINYTYHVNHSRDSETTFFNVVITEWRGFKKLMLFEYEMTHDFSSKYSFGETDFSNFDGLLHVNVLNADDDFPCNDSPGGGIPFTGGVGTSSGGGSGENQDGGNPHSEFFLRQLFTIAHMSSSYKAPTNNNNGGGSDGGGDDDGQIIHRSPRDFNYHLSVPASNDTSNPCGESEEIGVLTPINITNYVIVNLINDDGLAPCPKSVLNDLKSLSESTMASIIGKLDDELSIYHTNITTEAYDTQNGSPARTIRTPGAPSQYHYTIMIHPEYTPTTNKLGFATLILHEMLHAYFFSLLDDANNSNPDALNDFPLLFELSVAKNFGPQPQNIHHQIMADKYVDILSRALQEFNTGIPVPENVEPDQLYKDLAWGSLSAAPIFQTTNQLTQQDRTRISNRYAAEILNYTVETESPAGVPCTE
ncbi:hypothetical protein [Flavobacterium sp.]|uniref:hypothetical protein n=1 Tax=Flavobacterium sp. TaxID=239 RepID=UPI002638F284|nr:hypothetical protein [Flavobacterium sp.]